MDDLRTLTAADLTAADASAVRRIFETSEYTHYRVTPDELPGLIERLPAAGVSSAPDGRLARVTQGTLRAFLLVNWLVAPSAWIGGFGVTWSEGGRFERYLELLLPHIARACAARGARTLYYSGGDLQGDWLRDPLRRLGFALHSRLRSYDKVDFSVPSEGNTALRVRPFRPDDAAAVVEIERHGFEQLWRHDAASFLEVAATHPYFVVAEDEQGIVGYQFNALDATTGYLIRIAVHPRVVGMGVGTRLMAEATRYFQRHHVWRIALNTQEDNARAQALYQRFGFELVPPHGFVMAADVASLAARGR
ncbi:MAG TPA: GNAT family N-acetyltransferase [Ktedonobacterales bacterium]|nr:GNAT family N-acetyltransferase [Ktedonobacterales bacterium]